MSGGARISFRRFPDTITRRRTEPGHYLLGSYREGAVSDLPMRAALQPLALEDSDLESGSQLQERLKVYVPSSEGDLKAAFSDGVADRVLYDGKLYVVAESRTWPRFTRAILLRET